ncbi:MAG: hypothetical protein ACTXOO_05485 [Sodalis sp. (in: enterobacteria)]
MIEVEAHHVHDSKSLNSRQAMEQRTCPQSCRLTSPEMKISSAGTRSGTHLGQS